VGLIYVVPGRTDTLRMNGRARLVRSAPFFDQMIVKGHRPELALVVEIEQIFFHCAKAFMRAELWQPETWRPERLPSHATLVKSVQHTEETLEELERHYGPSYAKLLYG
jgi:predicted pyridoxine 5'-phosphate oxidase superfamily flavin-nucleotide-binding protein